MTKSAMSIVAAAGLLVGCGMSASTAYAGDKSAPKSSTTQTIVVNEDGESFKVVVKNGKIRAWHNGEEVEDDRISADDGVVIIYDEAGDDVRSFHVTASGEADGLFAVLASPEAPEAPEARFPRVAAPRPVIGVTVREIAGDDGSVLVLESVREGLPAARAGLEPGDRIVRIKGAEEVSTQALLEVISEAGAGGKFELVLEDDGDKRAVWVELDGAKAPTVFALKELERTPRGLVIERDKMRDIERRVRARAMEHEAHARHLHGQSKIHLEKMLHEHQAQAEELAKHAEKQAIAWMENNEGQVELLRLRAEELANELENNFGEFRGVDGDVKFFTVPDFEFDAHELGEHFGELAEIHAEGFEHRFEELDNRIDDLDDRLDDLMDEIEDSMESMFDRLEDAIERLEDRE